MAESSQSRQVPPGEPRTSLTRAERSQDPISRTTPTSTVVTTPSPANQPSKVLPAKSAQAKHASSSASRGDQTPGTSLSAVRAPHNAAATVRGTTNALTTPPPMSARQENPVQSPIASTNSAPLTTTAPTTGAANASPTTTSASPHPPYTSASTQQDNTARVALSSGENARLNTTAPSSAAMTVPRTTAAAPTRAHVSTNHVQVPVRTAGSRTESAPRTPTASTAAAATVSTSNSSAATAAPTYHAPMNSPLENTARASTISTAAAPIPSAPRASITQSALPQAPNATIIQHRPTSKPYLPHQRKLRERFSLTMGLVLTLGPLFIAVCMGTLAFLWFSDKENEAWRYVVVNNNLVTTLSGLAKIVEASLQLLVAVTCAMLAALLLEKFHVAMRDAAEVSLTRLTGDSLSLLGIFWNQLRGVGTRHWGLLLLLGFTSLNLFFSQAVTVILNTDLNLDVVRGYPDSQELPFGFQHYGSGYEGAQPLVQLHGTFWSKSPSIFPTFAEYWKAPVPQTGVVDTGITLRAFLPFAAQQDRQNVQSYSGRTTVIDTRVTCQIPNIRGINVTYQEQANTITLQGAVSATRHTPRLFSRTSYTAKDPDDPLYNPPPVLDSPVPIQCTVPIANGSSLELGSRLASSWRSSLCQLGGEGSDYSGGLISEFQESSFTPNITDDQSYNRGVAYLILNVTAGDPYKWRGILDGFAGKSAPFYQDRGEWRDFAFSGGELVLSASVCYASFLTADIPVQIDSVSNRTEPSAQYDAKLQSYIYPDVRRQMGQNRESLTDRNILSLAPHRSSWLANSSDELPPLEPYMRKFANMGGPYANGNMGNYSASLYDQQGAASTPSATIFGTAFIPDSFFVAFFQDIVTHGGNVAFALQSMYTVIAGMAYYNQMPQFDNRAITQWTNFITVNVATTKLGFIIVMVVIVLDLLAVAFVTVWFLRTCQYSILGSAWAVVAQTTSPLTEPFVGIARGLTDKEVERGMAQRSRALERVGIGPVTGNGSSAGPAVTEIPPYSVRAGITSMSMRRRA